MPVGCVVCRESPDSALNGEARLDDRVEKDVFAIVVNDEITVQGTPEDGYRTGEEN